MKTYFLVMLAYSAIGFMGMSTVSANSLSHAQDIEAKTNQSSQKAQQGIDKEAQRILDLQNQIEQASIRLSNQTVYRDHLTQLVRSQEDEKQQLHIQITQIEETRQGIVPLMYQMLSELDRILHSDLPIRFTARTERLNQLQLLMGRADISDAEKFRRLLEAFQIEMDYGHKISAYQQEITLEDGSKRVVEQLHIGRITLISRSADKKHAWLWLQEKQKWHAVETEVFDEVNVAFDIANKHKVPQLLRLPLSISSLNESQVKENI